MDTDQRGTKPRKTGAEREREGAIYGLLIGLAAHLPAIVAIGAVVALIGLVMWGAGIARRDN
jgi:uncharacterized membrane protein